MVGGYGRTIAPERFLKKAFRTHIKFFKILLQH
jgi:hypothetical protein